MSSATQTLQRRASVLDGLSKRLRAECVFAVGGDVREAERRFAALRPLKATHWIRRAEAVLEARDRGQRLGRRERNWRAQHPRRTYPGLSARNWAIGFPFKAMGVSKSSLYSYLRTWAACGTIWALAVDGRGSGQRGRVMPKVQPDALLFRAYCEMVRGGSTYAAAYRYAEERARAGDLKWYSRRTIERRYAETMNPRRED